MPGRPHSPEFEKVFAARMKEADAYYDSVMAPGCNEDQRRVVRQAYAGLLWSKQFYHYVVKEWVSGDPATPPPPRDMHRRATRTGGTCTRRT